MPKFAYFTVASDDFTPGVYCLAKSLKKITQYPLYVISINITEENKKKLESISRKQSKFFKKNYGMENISKKCLNP